MLNTELSSAIPVATIVKPRLLREYRNNRGSIGLTDYEVILSSTPLSGVGIEDALKRFRNTQYVQPW